MDPGSGSETSEDLSFENRGRKCICCVDQWVKNKKKSKKESKKDSDKPIELTEVNA